VAVLVANENGGTRIWTATISGRIFFDTYQSLSSWTKGLWLMVPPTFLLGLIALILRHRVAVKEAENSIRGDLVYTIHRDADDQLHVYRHGAALEREPALALLDHGNGGKGQCPLRE